MATGPGGTNRSLAEIDALAVNQFAKHVRSRRLAPKTVHNILGYFRAFLTPIG
jgi:hypothetical protein